MGSVVHISTLLLMQFPKILYLMNFLLSLTSTDYILSIVYFGTLGETTSNTNCLYCTPLTRDSRWTFLFRLSCWLSIIFLSICTAQCLGFNLAPSSIFFLLSLPSHLYHSLRYYVVVILALRVPSSSVSLLHGFAPCLHTSFPICLLKFSYNSSHD